MPASIGVNLRVTGHCKQGGRKYMEDYFSVAYQQTEDEKDLEYAFFGIFDGHGGSEAATFAKEHLMESIVRQRMFWSEKDEDVSKAIKEGFIQTHLAMWKEQERWPKTKTGLPSTAGTTASIAFIRRGKIFIGHVGDSGIVLGYQTPGSTKWDAKRLTKDHKPENVQEFTRIKSCGGKVVTKSGVPRVVWYRPHIGHKGPITRSTPHDEIPFLAVARSLGDLWSYNSANNEFIVSPEPDTAVIPINTDTFRCLIFGTDGLWNMIYPALAVSIVQNAEHHNALSVVTENPRAKSWINPSMSLVERALEKWCSTKMRADNTSVVTLMLDPPGPPRVQVIKNAHRTSKITPTKTTESDDARRASVPTPEPSLYPETGLEIVTRYDDRSPSLLTETRSLLKSLPKESRYTEECLDRFHKLYESTLSPDRNEPVVSSSCEFNSTPNSPNHEIIQSNVVSSSSDADKNAESKVDLSPVKKRGRKVRCSLPEGSPEKKRGRPPKRERNEDENGKDEPAPSKLRRSRSLGPRDLQGVKSNDTVEPGTPSSRLRTRGSSFPNQKKPKTPPKQNKQNESYESDSENVKKDNNRLKTRSRSVEPEQTPKTPQKTNHVNDRILKSDKSVDNNTESPSSRLRSQCSPSVSKKIKTPPKSNKRERYESDEENVSKECPSKYLIRSRSLGPRDISDASSSSKPNVRHSERNLRERNTNSEASKMRTRSASTAPQRQRKSAVK